MIRVAHPESRIRNLTFTRPGSRGQKRTGSRIRIRNTASRCSHSAANVPPRLTPDIFFIKTKRFLLIVSLAFLLLFLEKFLLLDLLAFLFSASPSYLPPFLLRFSLIVLVFIPLILERFLLLVQLIFFLLLERFFLIVLFFLPLFLERFLLLVQLVFFFRFLERFFPIVLFFLPLFLERFLLLVLPVVHCCGSGIRCLFDPWTGSGIRNMFFSGSWIPDHNPIFFRAL
jgi:hypothetical protein